MGLTKGILLGTGAALVSVAAAQAADLPTKKAAPVEYVRICDAYGTGFFYIPGTDTCIRIGGRVRADYSWVARDEIYSGLGAQNVQATITRVANTQGGSFVVPSTATTIFNTASSPTAGPGIITSASGPVYLGGATGASVNVGTATYNTGTTNNGPVYNNAAALIGPGVANQSTVYAPGSVVGVNTPYHLFTPGAAGNARPVVFLPKAAQNLTGWEARARISFDTRTQTAWGVVQAVGQLRMARTTGVLSSDGTSALSSAAGVTLEAAYVRFAGFTFGAARDNFANMPSVMYMAAGHWASFANGSQQLAYTYSFGGGFSGTIAIQNYVDTAAAAAQVGNQVFAIGGPITTNCLSTTTNPVLPTNAVTNNCATLPGNLFNSAVGSARYVQGAPQLNGRIDWQQSWGAIGIAAAWARPDFVAYTSALAPQAAGVAVSNGAYTSYKDDPNVWAVGGTLQINLPQLARGSRLDLTAAYADGMTEYTTNWNSFKSSDSRRNAGGFVLLPTSVVLGPNGAETVKSWSVGGLFQHYWTPQWRTSLAASYGQIQGTTTSKSCLWNGSSCFGDASVQYYAAQLAWLPLRDFEIGIELAYARVSQDVRGLTGNFGYGVTGFNPVYASDSVVKRTDDGISGRLRVERNF
ncbi:MAG: porin [Beijerinckiaceae bacterium]